MNAFLDVALRRIVDSSSHDPRDVNRLLPSLKRPTLVIQRIMPQIRSTYLALLLLLRIGPAHLSAAPAESDIAFFEKSIRPLLTEHCLECHSTQAGKRKGGLLLDSRIAIAQGGDSGPAIVPGKPDESRIVVAVRGHDADLRMPPKKSLDSEKAELLAEWVRRGAPDPREETAKPRSHAGMSLAEGRTFWSFKPVTRPPLPESPSLNPVDHLVLAKLNSVSLVPAKRADRRTLIRRASYTLSGLPPSPEEVDAFLADESPSAFSDLVERLLANPAYGERWGRHWLDVVRYADTCGNASDYPVPQLRLYRDWVVSAFNADTPYDRFLRDQIAGDLLGNGSVADRASGIIATGYLALARRFAGKAGAPHLTIEDTIDNLSKAMLGVTLSCARCHDHKFDPFTMKDYYALYGFFSSTRYPYPGAEGDTKQSDFVPLMESSEVEELIAPHRAAVTEMEKTIKNLEQQLKDRSSPDSSEEKPVTEELKKRIADAKKQLAELTANAPLIRDAYAVAEAKEVGDARVQNRGEPKNLGATVRRGFPAVLGGMTLPENTSGSGRATLANWLTDSANPLTARVMVNRIWQHHFGRGLVATPNDFGKQGLPPANAELLDFLASEFVRGGWSVKAMHRLILNSETWQRASTPPPKAQSIDPLNALTSYHTRTRLDAESLRDTLLQLSGELRFGPAPEHPFPARSTWKWTQHNPFSASYDSKHRSLYLMQARLKKHPFLALFDGPDPSAATANRSLTTTPLQALFALNHPLIHETANAVAQRSAATQNPSERVAATYRILFQRSPDTSEHSIAAEFFSNYQTLSAPSISTVPEEAWIAFTRSLLSSNELLFLD